MKEIERVFGAPVHLLDRANDQVKKKSFYEDEGKILLKSQDPEMGLRRG